MTRNMGTYDRAIRLIAGIALVVLPLLGAVATGAAWLWWAMVVVGVVLVATSLTGVCPAYSILGIRTGGDR
jgi:membrane-bound ClpP family serine protease